MITFKNSNFNIMKVGTRRELLQDVREMVSDGCKLCSRVPVTRSMEDECVIYQYNNKSTLLRYGAPVIIFLPYKDAVNLLATGDYVRIEG